MKQTTNLQSIKPAINNISNHHFISCTVMRNELSIYLIQSFQTLVSLRRLLKSKGETLLV